MELKVRVRLLNDPPLWCWELVDPVTGKTRDNSWTSEWEAYDSPEEALRAATARLTAEPDETAVQPHAA